MCTRHNKNYRRASWLIRSFAGDEIDAHAYYDVLISQISQWAWLRSMNGADDDRIDWIPLFSNLANSNPIGIYRINKQSTNIRNIQNICTARRLIINLRGVLKIKFV